MSRRILFVTRYFPPLDSIATLRLYSWAKYFRDQGADVTVLTTSKQGQILVPLDLDTTGMRVIEVDYWDPIVAFSGNKQQVLSTANNEKKGLKQRLTAWAMRFYRTRMNERMPGRTDPWILPAIRELKKQKQQGEQYDVVISSYGPPSAHVVGRWAKKLVAKRWIADYRDLWVENASYRGVWPFTWFEHRLEKSLLRHADQLTTISGPYRDFLQKKFPAVPAHVVTNGYAPELIDQAQGDYYEGRDPTFRIVYTGAVYPDTRDPSPLFQAMRKLIDQNRLAKGQLEVLFYGGVADGLQQLIERFGLQQLVRHEGCVSQRDAYRIQKSAQALLFLEDPKPKVEGVLTGKLFEYLYMKAPVLGVGIGKRSAAGELIREAGAGEVLGQDVDGIAATLERWLDGSSQPARNASVVQRYSRDACAEQVWEMVCGGAK